MASHMSSHYPPVTSEAVLSSIEEELERLQYQKAATEDALRSALAKKKEALAIAAVETDAAFQHGYPINGVGLTPAQVRSQTRASRSPTPSRLRGIDKAAWEQAIVEDELAQPLKVSPELVKQYIAEEEAAERRLASELSVHMAQIRQLRQRLAEREESAERRRQVNAYSSFMVGGSVSGSTTPSVVGPEASMAGYVAMGAAHSAVNMLGHPSGSGVPLPRTSAANASIHRLEALENRILQLEAGLLGGVGYGDGPYGDTPGAYMDPEAAHMYSSLVRGGVHPQHEYDGGTGSPITPSGGRYTHEHMGMGFRDPSGMSASAASGYAPGVMERPHPGAHPSIHGGQPLLSHSYSGAPSAAMPLSIPLLAQMTGGVRSGGAGVRGAGGRGGGSGRGLGEDGRSVAGSTLTKGSYRTSGMSTALSGSASLPNVARTPVLGFTFKRDKASGKGENMSVSYTLQPPTRPRDRSPAAYSSASGSASVGYKSRASDAFMSRDGGTTFLTAVPEAVNEDEPDAIERWMHTKKQEIKTLVRDQRASSQAQIRGRAPGPTKPAPSPAARSQAPQQSRLSKSLPPSRSRSTGALPSGAVGSAVAAQRSRMPASGRAPAPRPGGAPTGLASVRTGARSAVRSAALGEFTSMRKDFESQRAAIRSDLRNTGAPPPARGRQPAPARVAPPIGSRGGGGLASIPARRVGATAVGAGVSGGSRPGGRSVSTSRSGPPLRSSSLPPTKVGVQRTSGYGQGAGGSGGGGSGSVRGPPTPSRGPQAGATRAMPGSSFPRNSSLPQFQPPRPHGMESGRGKGVSGGSGGMARSMPALPTLAPTGSRMSGATAGSGSLRLPPVGRGGGGGGGTRW